MPGTDSPRLTAYTDDADDHIDELTPASMPE